VQSSRPLLVTIATPHALLARECLASTVSHADPPTNSMRTLASLARINQVWPNTQILCTQDVLRSVETVLILAWSSVTMAT